MPGERLERILASELQDLAESGRAKGRGSVIVGVIPAKGARGPRYLLEGEGERPFLRMNANA